jgi:hypothetical protein
MEPYYFSPSARTASNIAEFVAACQTEPHVAAEHLRRGYFEPWLRDAGRNDLAEAAARLRSSRIAGFDALRQFVETAFEMQSRRPVTRRARGT